MSLKVAKENMNSLWFDAGQKYLEETIYRMDDAFGLSNKPNFPKKRNDSVESLRVAVNDRLQNIFAKQGTLSSLHLTDNMILKLATFLWRLKQLTLFAQKVLSPHIYKNTQHIHYMLDRTLDSDDDIHFTAIGENCSAAVTKVYHQLCENSGIYRGCLNSEEDHYNDKVKYKVRVESNLILDRLLEYIVFASVDRQFRLIPLSEFMAGECELNRQRENNNNNDDDDVGCFVSQLVCFVEKRIGITHAKDFPRMSKAGKSDGKNTCPRVVEPKVVNSGDQELRLRAKKTKVGKGGGQSSRPRVVKSHTPSKHVRLVTKRPSDCVERTAFGAMTTTPTELFQPFSKHINRGVGEEIGLHYQQSGVSVYSDVTTHESLSSVMTDRYDCGEDVTMINSSSFSGGEDALDLDTDCDLFDFSNMSNCFER